MFVPLVALVLPIWLAAPSPTPATTPVSRMTLKNGTVYFLKEPPRISGGRIVFTTVEGKVYSLSESEVDSIGLAPTPTLAPRVTYNPQDSRDLGAIARKQRGGSGLTGEVSPTAAASSRAARSSRRAKPTRTPRPRPSTTPSPGAGKALPG